MGTSDEERLGNSISRFGIRNVRYYVYYAEKFIPLSQFHFSVDNCSSLCHVKYSRITSQAELVISVTWHVFPMCYFLPLVFKSICVRKFLHFSPGRDPFQKFLLSWITAYLVQNPVCSHGHYYTCQKKVKTFLLLNVSQAFYSIWSAHKKYLLFTGLRLILLSFHYLEGTGTLQSLLTWYVPYLYYPVLKLLL